MYISLKTKMAVAASVLFVLFVVTASYFTLSYFENMFKESISRQQFAHVSTLAKTIDDKLLTALRSLTTVASSASSDVVTDTAAAQRFLDERIGLKAHFDNGIFLFDKRGILIAESPYKAGRRGKDFSFREWVQKTLATGKPFISDPYISTYTPGLPAIAMTAPLFDKQGEIIGMMTGSLALTGKNGLAELSGIRIGKTGYLYITDNHRIMLVHPDKNRIMKPVAAPGVNKIYDRATQGFEGTGETITSYGVPMISSVKRLESTSWILIANYPISEAHAPLVKARYYFSVAASVATLVLLLLTWCIMRRLMSPLVAVTRQLKHLPDLPAEERSVTVGTNDEIGVLATAFNNMIAALNKQQTSLRESEEKFRLLADFTVDWEYWIDPGQSMIYTSPSCWAFSGYHAEEFLTSPGLLCDIVHPDHRRLFEYHLQFVRQPNLGVLELEFRIITRDGEVRWLSHVSRPIFGQDGTYLGRRTSNRDITERRHVEEKLQEKALLLESEVAERQKVQEALAIKQQQLEELNSSLEERIDRAISELRQKDQLLIQQGRSAAMGEMVNNIAHQWRQPLNNVGLIVQNLRVMYEMDQLTQDEMNHGVEMAMDTIKYMSRTIDDFRHFFRKDKLKLSFSIKDMVYRTLDFVSANLKHNHISVELEIRGNVVAFGYPNEYSQVLLNIVNNARDVLTERDVAEPSINIRIFREKGLNIVTIRDNGGGISDDVLPKVFDPYFSTKSLKGTGIGLYMSKVIIEQNMGGTLTVRNNKGGAEFRIELPSA